MRERGGDEGARERGSEGTRERGKTLARREKGLGGRKFVVFGGEAEERERKWSILIGC